MTVTGVSIFHMPVSSGILTRNGAGLLSILGQVRIGIVGKLVDIDLLGTKGAGRGSVCAIGDIDDFGSTLLETGRSRNRVRGGESARTAEENEERSELGEEHYDSRLR